MIDKSLPIGTVLPYVGLEGTLKDLEPVWRLCNGDRMNPKDDPDLFTAIGTSFGGDGPTFYLPDLRGMFLRGVSGTSGNDPDAKDRNYQQPGGHQGNNVGSMQADAFEGHAHNISIQTRYEDFGYGAIHANDTAGEQHGAWEGFEVGDPRTGRVSTETRPKNVYVYYIIKCRHADT